MNNSQISNRINRLAAMMTLLDENPYKVRAFEKAAMVIDRHPEEMGVLIDEDRLKDVPGIGDSLAHLILHYAKSGSTSLENDLESRLPPGLPLLLNIKGLGTKKVQTLWQDHQVHNPIELGEVCQSNELAQWKGFGPKLQDKLVDALAFQAKHAKDFHLDVALKVAQHWQEKLSNIEGVGRLELSGQLRRCSELVQCVDFIVETNSRAIIKVLTGELKLDITGVDPLSFSDPTGLPIKLWMASPQSFPLRQLQVTGGDSYGPIANSALNQAGVTQESIETVDIGTPKTSEQDLCQKIGLQWIEPVLRDTFTQFPEDQVLIQNNDIKGVLHAHSTWSDGRNSLEEMVVAAQALGYQYFGISDHSQAAYYANGLKAERVNAQWERIDELNEVYPNIHILKGIEADILRDGSLDYDEDLLSGFDFVIASIHSHFHLNPTQQTDRIIRALQNPFSTILGHPTGRMLLAREGYAPDMPAIIDAAASYGKVIEINTTPKRLDLDWRYLKLAKSKGVKVSINPDAHGVAALKTIHLGVMIAQKGGLGSEDVINTMKPAEFNIFLERQ